MHQEPNHRLDRYRKRHPTLGASPAGASYGYFEAQYGRSRLRIISGGRGEPWEHVSVSLPDRTPTWEEMCFVKDLFWSDEETVLQFHPRKSAYINHHRNCLHLWKRLGWEQELPPKGLI